MLFGCPRCKFFGIIGLLILASAFLEAKNDLKIKVPQDSIFQVGLNQCSGQRNNNGRYVDFYFKYDSTSGAVFYRSGKGWTLVPDKKRSKAIITVELDVSEQNHLVNLLINNKITMNDKIMTVSDFLSSMLSDGNFNVEIMEMRPELINHNSIYYKITQSETEIPDEPLIEKIYLSKVEDLNMVQDQTNEFFDLIKDYLPEFFHYNKEDLMVDFEAGVITLKSGQIAAETDYFKRATFKDLQIHLKHEDFVDMIKFEQLGGSNDPEFDFIMKNELRNSMFQIQKINGEFHLISQKFGFNTLVPRALSLNKDLLIEVFNDEFEIAPGKMEKGRIVFQATADRFKSVPQLEFVVKTSTGEYVPAKNQLLKDLEVYFKGEKVTTWNYNDPLYRYPGIEYTFRLPQNNFYNRKLDGELLRENFHSCRLVANTKIVQVKPDFILSGNYSSDQEDIFPVNIHLNIPAGELPISFRQLLKNYGHIDNLEGNIYKYILMNNHISFDKDQWIDESNQNFFVSKPMVYTDFYIKLNYDFEPDYDHRFKYSVIPYVNPERVEYREARSSDNKLIIERVQWPVNPHRDDFFMITLNAPVGYEFTDGNTMKKIQISDHNRTPEVKLKRKMDDMILYIDLEKYSENDQLDSAKILEELSKRLKARRSRVSKTGTFLLNE